MSGCVLPLYLGVSKANMCVCASVCYRYSCLCAHAAARVYENVFLHASVRIWQWVSPGQTFRSLSFSIMICLCHMFVILMLSDGNGLTLCERDNAAKT